MTQNLKTDILIVGAGPVGAHAARLLGERGFKVVLIEKNTRDACGAQWVNGVPLWQLNDAGLGMPPKEEVYHEGGSFSIVSPLGPSRITLKDAQLLDIDMRHFGQRLLQLAESHENVQVYYETGFRSVRLDDAGRPVAATTTAGLIDFKLIIDASGLSAIVRKQVPALSQLCPQVQPEDLCTAAQEVCDIADPDGAKAFLERNHAGRGEAIAFVNVEGGFSLLRMLIDYDLKSIAFLTGARALPERASAKELIRRFVSENPWVGATRFGGQRPIPLRRPYAALAAPGIALLGDAGCQVYPAHASGIGISLLAAKILADALNEAAQSANDIGAAQALSLYAYRFHKKYGSLLANSDASRRFSQELSKEETHLLIHKQLLTTRMINDSLFQKPVKLYIRDLPSQILKALQHPILVSRVIKVGLKGPAIALLMKTYPKNGVEKPGKLLKFERRMERIVSF